MIIEFENVQVKLDEILNDDFNLSEFIGIEFSVLKLISEWFSHQDTFVFKTSGSTGHSKEINIHRKMIEYSTNATFNFIDPDRHLSSSLLCLDPNFIGGAMVVFRAIIMNHDLRVISPSNNPLAALKTNERYGLVSLVPMQYLNSTPELINQIDKVLIGGGQIDVIQNNSIKTDVYSTFGMTETVSHMALRRIDEETFSTTGDTTISVNNDAALCIKGTLTNHQLIETNDIIELISDTEFKWIGRKDFIINSGGIKLNPERIENALSHQLNVPFIVSYLPDQLLGQKLILIIEANHSPSIDYSKLSKYEIPKEVFCISEIPRTLSGKIDRNKTQKLISSMRGKPD